MTRKPDEIKRDRYGRITYFAIGSYTESRRYKSSECTNYFWETYVANGYDNTEETFIRG